MSEFESVTVQDLVRRLDAAEVWRPIEGWPGYTVSSWGRVRGPRGMLDKSIVHGYEKVCLSNTPDKKTMTVHRLVATAFLGKPPFIGAMIAHNDGNKRNNRVGNLRWASAKENQADRTRHGTRTVGSNVDGAKLKEADIPTIRARAKLGEKYKNIAADYGVSVSTIHLIEVNKTWKSVRGASWV